MKIRMLVCTLVAMCLTSFILLLDRENEVAKLRRTLASANIKINQIQYNLDLRTRPDLTPSVRRAGKSVEVTYGEFRGRPLLLVLDQETGRVSLRINTGDRLYNFVNHDAALEELKKQVMFLMLSENPTNLANTGVTFKNVGGYAIWSPYGELGPEGESQSLFFAEKASFTNNCIVASGRAVKDPYWPYSVAPKQ